MGSEIFRIPNTKEGTQAFADLCRYLNKDLYKVRRRGRGPRSNGKDLKVDDAKEWAVYVLDKSGSKICADDHIMLQRRDLEIETLMGRLERTKHIAKSFKKRYDSARDSFNDVYACWEDEKKWHRNTSKQLINTQKNLNEANRLVTGYKIDAEQWRFSFFILLCVALSEFAILML